MQQKVLTSEFDHQGVESRAVGCPVRSATCNHLQVRALSRCALFTIILSKLCFTDTSRQETAATYYRRIIIFRTFVCFVGMCVDQQSMDLQQLLDRAFSSTRHRDGFIGYDDTIACPKCNGSIAIHNLFVDDILLSIADKIVSHVFSGHLSALSEITFGEFTSQFKLLWMPSICCIVFYADGTWRVSWKKGCKKPSQKLVAFAPLPSKHRSSHHKFTASNAGRQTERLKRKRRHASPLRSSPHWIRRSVTITPSEFGGVRIAANPGRLSQEQDAVADEISSTAMVPIACQEQADNTIFHDECWSAAKRICEAPTRLGALTDVSCETESAESVASAASVPLNSDHVFNDGDYVVGTNSSKFHTAEHDASSSDSFLFADIDIDPILLEFYHDFE